MIQQNNGIIGNIIVVLVGIFVLSLIFGFNILDILEHPNVTAFFSAIWNLVLTLLKIILDGFNFIINFIGSRA